MKPTAIPIIFCACVASFFFTGLPAAELTPDEIVQKVDDVRNPELDYTVIVSVSSYRPHNEPRIVTYDVMVKGRDRTVVKTKTPEMERGRMLLMRDKDFWAFFPEVAKPIRISFQERLTGEVANGDIARTNFSQDYSAKLLRSERIEDKDYYVLELTAKADDVTYGKAVLWVAQETNWPLKAEFYAASGRFLKTCLYENYALLAGRMRPSRLVMTDALVKNQYSVIEYEQMQTTELPEKYFTKEYLKKMD